MSHGVPELLFWNDVALEVTRAGPALAIVHLAMYDACVAVGRPADLGPHLQGLPAAPAGASVTAAIAGAAHETLSRLFPEQQALFDRKLAEAGLPYGDLGERFGREIAAALLEEHARDASVDRAENPPVRVRARGTQAPPVEGLFAPLDGARARRLARTRRALVDPPFDATSAGACRAGAARAEAPAGTRADGTEILHAHAHGGQVAFQPRCGRRLP
jgi:hypothetical protein